ncbi:DUF4214 domain-containing protein [Pararhizobium haloflavum]|uniref:DUF4214 domain-containing protein n=1 Tax=Pararhizobium haloflavum TaxID=2037914 RepID=UPI000C18D3C3|nr:DUF4214 domain-containing protein [Pararhizobium haloflavum]
MATVQGIYIALFGRPADPLGLEFYQEATNNGENLDVVYNSLAQSEEYLSRFEGQNSIQIVNSVYLSLFGRSAEIEGLTYWSARLESGELSIEQIAIAIYDGALGDDLATIQNKEAAANLFTASIDTGEELVAYQGEDAAAAGRDFLDMVDENEDSIPTQAEVDAFIDAEIVDGGPSTGDSFVLTDAVDQLVGTNGDDTFVGTDDTYQTGDSIDGGSGTDRLELTVTNAATGGQIVDTDSVEQVYVRNIAAGTNVDASGFVGLQQIWSDRSSQSLTATGLAAGTTIGLMGTNFGFSAAFAAGAIASGDTINFAVNGTNGGAYADLNADTGLDATDEVAANISVTGDNRIDLGVNNGDGDATNDATLTSITLSGTGNIALSPQGAGIGADQTFEGVTDFDASGLEGGVSVDLTQNDADITVTGSAGDDYVNIANLDADDSVDLGEGTDILGIDEANLQAAAAATGVEYIAINSSAGAGLAIDGDDFDVDGFVLNADTTDLDLDAFDGISVNVATSQADISFNDTESVSINVGFPEIGTGAVEDLIGRQGDDSITIGALDVDGSTDVSFMTGDADQDLTITTLNADNDVEMITVAGAGDFDVTGTTNGLATAADLATLDLSGLTGVFDSDEIGDGDGGVTVLVGNLADNSVINLSTAASARDFIEFGAELDNEITIANFEEGDNITSDVLDFSELGVTALADLDFADAGANVEITSDLFDGTLTLTGVNEAALNESNFIFAA